MVRTSLFVLSAVASFLLFGALGAWGYGEYRDYRQMQTLLPQIIGVVNAHEAALQKITGAPTIPPVPGTGAGASAPK